LQFLLSGTGDSSVPFVSTNYSRSAPNLLALTGALTDFGGNDNLAPGGSFTDAALNSLLGLSGLSAGIGGRDGDTLFGVILNAVENDTNSRILSKPFNMTLDNGTSSLLVGQEVPVSTGQVLGNDFANSFQTVDRKEIGIKLDVTPRVSDDDTVRLDIAQEVSNIAGVVGDITPDLILNKRNISTTVLADNGEIIVLGGLIEQSDTVREEKVPVLGDAPLVGRLFRSEGKATERTNLMVFIRPTIIRNKREAEAATLRSYSYIRAEELWSGNSGDANALDAFVTEVLGTPPPQ
jgi:general secretion pathway protein D